MSTRRESSSSSAKRAREILVLTLGVERVSRGRWVAEAWAAGSDGRVNAAAAMRNLRWRIASSWSYMFGEMGYGDCGCSRLVGRRKEEMERRCPFEVS